MAWFEDGHHLERAALHPLKPDLLKRGVDDEAVGVDQSDLTQIDRGRLDRPEMSWLKEEA